MSESIERVERALAAATPGKWVWVATGPGEGDITLGALPDPEDEHHILTPHVCKACRERNAPCMSPSQADAAAITTAHNLLPRFIDVVRAARDIDQETARVSLSADETVPVDPALIVALADALAALDTAIQEELPKEGSDDQ